jgi:hypothetical protein
MTPSSSKDRVSGQPGEIQGLNLKELYEASWKALDSDYWRALTAQGRLYRPRIDVFLNYWLTMKLLRQVPSDQVFANFRDNLPRLGLGLPSVLAELATDAGVFAGLDALPSDSAPGCHSPPATRRLLPNLHFCV